MRTAIVYYSLSGNTKLLAEAISETVTPTKVIRLKTYNEISDNKFTKYLIGGKQALFNALPEIEPLNFDFSSIDLLFLGTPIWAWRPAPAVRTFLKSEILPENIALFATHGGGPGKFNERFTNMLSNKNISFIDFKEPLKYNTDKAVLTAKKWASDIIENILRKNTKENVNGEKPN